MTVKKDLDGDQRSQVISSSDPQSEAGLFRKIVEQIHEGIWIIDKNSNTTFVNYRMSEMLGYSIDEMLGKSLFSFMSKDTVPVAEKMVSRRMQGIKESHDFKFMKKDGTPLIASLGASPLFDENDEYSGAVAGVQDITERRRTEEALAASERRFMSLCEHSFDGITIIGDNGQVLYESPNLAQILGYQLGERIGVGIFESVHPDDLTKTQEAFLMAVQNPNQIFRLDLRIRHKNEMWRWIECAGRNMTANSDIGGILINYRDITERKKAEEALLESEQKFKSIIDTSQEWIWAIDTEARHTYCNPALDKILGYNPSEFYGIDAYSFMHPEDAAIIRKEFPEYVAKKKGWTGLVVRWRHKDGSYRFLESNSTPILGPDGELLGFWGADRDVTDRLKLEQQIHQSQKLESLGLLAGGIAHDFNNLMGGIFGYIDLALATSTDRNVSDYLSSAIGAIDRARNLTGQLLTFAKGGAPIREICDLSSVIRDASKFALSGSNVSSVFDIADNLWLCNFDRNQIIQVIDNIVINAQQAMPMGGTVSISAINISFEAGEKGALKAGNYVRISIHDEGTGIPDDIIPRIFDPFFTTKQKGSGLGLSICHSIIKRHDGWIDVESIYRKGTTFHIYLPASVEEPVQVDSAKTVSVHRGSGRILIMDDEEIVRRATSKLINLLGYTVECKREGRETLSFINEEIQAGRSFTAILLDLTIPGGMDGKEVAKELQKLNLKTPVFVASGYSNDPVMAHPNDYGFTDSICKPFTIDELSAMFNRHLHQAQ